MTRGGSGAPGPAGRGRRGPGVLALLVLALALARSEAQVHIPALISESGVSRPEPRASPRAGPGINGPPVPPGDGKHRDLSQVPADCHAELGTDYGSDIAFVWGASYKTADAAECCAACKAHAATCGAGKHGSRFFRTSTGEGDGHCGDHKMDGSPVVCNAWVFCGEPQCFSFDVHNHSRGECWLKYVRDVHGPAQWSGGPIPDQMRSAPRHEWPWAVAESVWPWQMPAAVSWTAGVLAPEGARIEHLDPEHRPDWHKAFCRKHGC